jgi:hypothetical protein
MKTILNHFETRHRIETASSLPTTFVFLLSVFSLSVRLPVSDIGMMFAVHEEQGV